MADFRLITDIDDHCRHHVTRGIGAELVTVQVAMRFNALSRFGTSQSAKFCGFSAWNNFLSIGFVEKAENRRF